MRLIVLQQGAMIEDIVCGEEAIFVGAREDCRVRLQDPRIAPRQAVIYPQGDGWTVEQLAPECMIHVNDVPLSGKSALKTGDEIRVADFVLRAYPEHLDQQLGPELGTSRAQLERFVASRLPGGTVIKKPTDPLTIAPEQVLKIADFTQRVSQCELVEDLMDVALQTLLVNFAAQRAWMGVRRVNYGPMEYVEGRLLTGQPTDLPEMADALKPRVLDRIQYLLVPVYSREERSSVLAGPLRGPDGALGMLYIDTGTSGRMYEDKDMDHFVLFSAVIAAQLDAIFKQIAANRAALLEGEVAVAHLIQARLTPRKLPQWEKLQFGAFRETGRERAGDIYDVLKLNDGTANFMVAHTPVKGAMPSLLMAQAQSTFRLAAMHKDPAHIFLRSLNWVLYDGENDHPLNCFVGTIDPETGQIRYAVAGEARAFIIGNRGEERRLGTLEPTPPLGLARTGAYALLPEQLAPSETLVVFSPGVTTARNRNNEIFGEDRFVNILCDGFGQLASTMLKEMLTELRNFTQGGLQPEDITVLLAHFVGG
jgi:serine phosphatase RsbU (regulator of sigma subunit)